MTINYFCSGGSSDVATLPHDRARAADAAAVPVLTHSRGGVECDSLHTERERMDVERMDARSTTRTHPQLIGPLIRRSS